MGLHIGTIPSASISIFTLLVVVSFTRVDSQNVTTVANTFDAVNTTDNAAAVAASAISIEMRKSCANATFSARELIPFVLKNYSAMGRPIRNVSNPISVKVRFSLYSILDFDERANLLSLHGYFSMRWNDELLVWNSIFPFNCVRYIILPAKMVWTPTLTLRNSPDAGRAVLFDDNLKVYVSPKGEVEFDPQGQYVTTCAVDFTYFPFDEQVCHVQLESWHYGIEQLTSELLNETSKDGYIRPPFEIKLDEWVENSMWTLVDNYSYIKNDEGYNSAIFVMRLQRKPMFYFINVIAPSVIIGAVVTVIFTLPVDEMSKIDISVTCLLAYTVFETMVVSDMPKSSTSIPLLILYITLQMIYIAGIAIGAQAVVFLILQKGQFEDDLPPKWLAALCRGIGTLLFVHGVGELLHHEREFEEMSEEQKNNKSQKNSIAHISHTNFVTMMKSLNQNKSRQQRGRGHRGGHAAGRKLTNAEEQWHSIARVFDRICMVLYILALIVTPPYMYYVLPVAKPLDKNTQPF